MSGDPGGYEGCPLHVPPPKKKTFGGVGILISVVECKWASVQNVFFSGNQMVLPVLKLYEMCHLKLFVFEVFNELASPSSFGTGKLN